MTVAKDGTTSAAVDLQRAYDTLLVYVPTIDSSSVKVQVSHDGTTFADPYTTDPASGNQKAIITTAGTGALFWAIPFGYQHAKIVCGASQTTAARTFKIKGYRGP